MDLRKINILPVNEMRLVVKLTRECDIRVRVMFKISLRKGIEDPLANRERAFFSLGTESMLDP